MYTFEYVIRKQIEAAVRLRCWRVVRARIRKLATGLQDHFGIPADATTAELVNEYVPLNVWAALKKESRTRKKK